MKKCKDVDEERLGRNGNVEGREWSVERGNGPGKWDGQRRGVGAREERGERNCCQASLFIFMYFTLIFYRKKVSPHCYQLISNKNNIFFVYR